MDSCPSCGASVVEGAHFCAACGAPLAAAAEAHPPSVCARCGAALDPTARFCAACGTATGTARDTRLEERKLVTVLFADVTGSTELGEQLDPERLRAVLQRYFAAMSAAIGAWNGTVEKYIGDAVMAVFGVPVAREDDAERALHAATEMLERLQTLNVELQERYGVAVRIRIGVNTGEVVAPLDASRGGQMLVSGDAVNVAARLQGAGEPGEILAGERTYLAARHAFAFDEPVELDLKGKSRSVVARRVRGVLDRPQRGLPGLSAPMIGRDRELETLTSLLDETLEMKQPRLVVIYGPAGIGKSRIVHELIQHTSQRDETISVLRGRCLSAGRGITFWALGELLRTAIGVSLRDAPEVAQERLREEAGSALARLDLTDADTAETIAALAMTAGIRLDDNPLEQLPPSEVADAMARAWPRYITGLALGGPLVLAIEDLHWADEPMLDLLSHIVGRASGPILITVTARPEFAESFPSFAANAEASSVSLRPLNERQGNELVEQLLNVDRLPESLRAEIVSRADGNPFFVEELLRRLIDERVIVRQGDRWVATDAAADVLLPDSIHALLAARLDGLPVEEKRVLQEAAVIGRIFWPAPLESELGSSDGVRSSLGQLERRGLVSARPTSSLPGEVEYIFRHALIRDVAYASVPKTRRARAHADVARWIEHLAGERTDEVAELLAYHYHAAIAGEDADLAWGDDPAARELVRRRAFETLLVAGAALRGRNAIAKALSLHAHAQELALNDGERAAVLEQIGDDHQADFHGDPALAAYFAAVDMLGDGPAADRAIPRIAANVAVTVRRFGSFQEPIDAERVEALLDRGLRVVDDAPTRVLLLAGRGGIARAWISMNGHRFTSGTPFPVNLESRISDGEQSLAIADQLDRADLIYHAAQTLTELYWEAERPEPYRAAVARQLELLPRLQSAQQRVEVLFSASQIAFETGQLSTSRTLGEQALDAARNLSAHDMLHASFVLMVACFHLGEWDRVLELLGPHREAALSEGDVLCTAVRAGPAIGVTVLAERGNREEALRLVPPDSMSTDRTVRAVGGFLLPYAHALEEPELEERWLSILLAEPSRVLTRESGTEIVAALARRRRWEELRELLPMMRASAPLVAMIGPATDRAQALMLVEEGRHEEAATLLRSAIGEFERYEATWEAAQTREILADLLRDDADEMRAAALATYERLGARRRVEALRARLATSSG